MKKTLLAATVFLLLFAGGCAAAGGSSASQSPVESPAVSAAAVSGTPAPADSAEPAARPAPEETRSTEAVFVSSPPPAAEVQPPPAEPEEKSGYTCTLWIRCGTILEHMDLLDPDKAELVPADGVLLHEADVPFQDGESVFDVLLRVTREQKVHLEFVDTPLYHSAYVEGIGNLYEFDCGELSGWSYRVNGAFPDRGCSLYLLTDGDVVEWVYTCDLGRDVGGTNDLEG